MHMPTVIILGLSPTGLYAVREAHRAGFPVCGVTDRFECGRFSRFLLGAGKIWKSDSKKALLSRLLKFGHNASAPSILLPTNDRYIEFIGRHASDLHPFFHFPASYHCLSLDIMDKAIFSRMCQNYGLVMPGVWEATDQAELQALGKEIPFPCILKPSLIHLAVSFLRGQKVLIAKDHDQFKSLIRQIPPETGSWLVQEVIPGPESNITLFGGYFDRDSVPRQTFTARKLRQYPCGFGSASLVRSDICPETLETSIRFLQKIGFQGICGTEFKRDPRDGRLKIIEINPRPTLWFSITHSAGKRMVETACCDLADLPFGEEKPQTEGVIWRYALKDLYSAWFYARHGKEFIFPPPDLQNAKANPVKRAWPVFDPADPLPAFAEPVQYIKKVMNRIGQ